MPKFNLTRHKELWTWLSENPGKEKYDWPGWKEFDSVKVAADCYCFACYYNTEAEVHCNQCPLDWGESIDCGSMGSPYQRWDDYKIDIQDELLSAKIDGREAKIPQSILDGSRDCALEIANLPVKTGVECI